jgi:anti-sigma regulatory factor (Ser/Thr protein kinase)
LCNAREGGNGAREGTGASIHWQFHRVQSFQAFRHDLRLFFEQHDVSSEVSDDLTLATQEACNNACHCGSDGADFDVSVSCLDGTITVEVADRGRGFDFEAAKTTWPPVLWKGSGRGLFIMAALTDQMEVVRRRHGTLVRMFKAVD